MKTEINPPDITLEHLPKTADREDFSVRLQQAGNDYRFRLSLTGTVVAIWSVDPDHATHCLVERLVYSHGTAAAFDPLGFWFDANNSAITLDQTLNEINNKGWRAFIHPSIRTTLGAHLFQLVDNLDEAFTRRNGHPFVRSLDVLSERSQAGDDFDSDARDHAHFIYRVCLAAAIIDRFNFTSASGCLNGLRKFLIAEFNEQVASDLTEPFYMIRKLRKQYPIHEEFDESAEGIRTRRKQLEDPERYFGLTGESSLDWSRVRTGFVDGLEGLLHAITGSSVVET